MTVKITRLFLAVLTLQAAQPADAIARSPDDVTPLLAMVMAHSRTAGERLWQGYGSAPFGVLVVEADGERLFCQPTPVGFTAQEPDPATGCEVSGRTSGGLPDNLLATMPVFGPPATIVVGTPASTGLSPAAWPRVLLHEHFHQWQTSLPNYYARVAALDLADGDESGIWMLNFPIPYGDAEVATAHGKASTALAAALQARGSPHFPLKVRTYRAARAAFAAAVGTRNWRYLEFQFWQEGVARWTEIVLGRSLPNAAARASAEALSRETLSALTAPDLAAEGRTFVYAYGAAEAMLLESCNAQWREHYVDLLSMGPLLADCSRERGTGRPTAALAPWAVKDLTKVADDARPAGGALSRIEASSR